MSHLILCQVFYRYYQNFNMPKITDSKGTHYVIVYRDAFWNVRSIEVKFPAAIFLSQDDTHL